MGVESKIRELLEGKQIAEEVIDEVAGNQQPTSSADAHRPLDKKQGDATPPLQGSSNPNPEQQDLSGTNNPEGGLTSEVGKAASAKAGSAPRPQNSGAGQAHVALLINHLLKVMYTKKKTKLSWKTNKKF